MLGGYGYRPGEDFERSAAVATGKRRRNSITRLIEDVVDDTKDLVDDVVDRAKDVERDGRRAARRAVKDDDRRSGAAREREMDEARKQNP
jgi:hypothetical protein